MIESSFFYKLPLWSQAEVLEQQGTHLALRQQGEWRVSLYVLEHHFVELWEKDGLRVVSTFKPAASAMAILEPYAAHIDIQRLLEA
ncbi:hypothetical protein [Pontibacter chitinilyticus]|uniref:hypothetical protein n=1 Tax=Pontibacter chitinilyticus TaxID=2674989 RepID=UPI00321C0A31